MKPVKNCRLWYDLISRKELIREELRTLKYAIDVSCIDIVSKYHIKRQNIIFGLIKDTSVKDLNDFR